MTRLISIFIIFCFVSCLDNSKDYSADNITTDKSSIEKSLFDSVIGRQNAKLCDTCISTLIVSHHECTECKDLQVDSGTVYVSQKAFQEFDSTQLKKGGYRHLNTTDLYFDDRNDFIKLWSDTVLNENFGNIYRVTGKITGYKYALRLKLISFVKIERK